MTTRNSRGKRRTPPRTPTRVIDATDRLAGAAPAAAATLAPPAKGRLWYDYEIPDAFLGGLPRITNKLRWVREHFPRATRVKIGRDSAWFEADIRVHLAQLSDLQAAG